ncbi:MAG: DUF4153 domain-containing protein, partial [Gemmatimonadetes bacterium]|nr:DUF4153 domain-containing protein [Gemmatimonadota bacterium]
MKLPSIESLVAGAARTARRFPAALLCAVTAATAANVALDATGNEDEWVRLVLTALMGLPLFTTLTYLCERRDWSAGVRWGVRLAGFVGLALFWWGWGSWSEMNQVHRFFHLAAALHLAAASVAYIGVREPHGFWQFNRELFLRFLIGGIFSAVLFAGLSIALLGIDNLLGIDVDEETYVRLWFVVAMVFQTWFFLAGVPDDFAELEARRDYPRGLKVFSQYVLLPLVSIYLVILTLYLGRVLITRTWPSGWIGDLVSALAALGILSLLLSHPERERADQPWL